MKKIKLTDVAAEAGVSIATVSRVINQTGYVSADVKKNVHRAILATGYQMPVPTEEAAPDSPKLVGIILKKLPSNMYFEALNYSFLKEIELQGMLAITIFCDELTNATLRIQAQKLLACKVSGLIISGFQDSSILPEVRSLLLDSGIPVVFVERLADSHGFNQVCVNNTLGGYLAARHLLSRGHRKIIYIGRGYLDTDSGSRRLNGFLKAIEESPDSPEYVVKICKSSDPEEAFSALLEAERELPGFTAVQAWYDGYLIGAMKYLHLRGLRTPDDVELIGQDDSYSKILVPKLSSVCMPFDEMAHAAIGIICDWQDKTREHFVKTINLEPKLILR